MQMAAHRQQHARSGATCRSFARDAVQLPVAWLLAIICVCTIMVHDLQLQSIRDGPVAHETGSSSSPERRQTSYSASVQAMGQLMADAHLVGPVGQLRCLFSIQRQRSGLQAGPLGQLRCLFGIQRQRSGLQAGPLGSVSLAAVAAHAGDLGLAAAVFLPQLLLLLLIVNLLGRWSAHGPTAAGENSDESWATSTQATSATGAASSTARSILAQMFCDSGTTGATVFLAVAKLLPKACGALVAAAGAFGLRDQHPTSQALHLMHPITPFLLATMTLLSQAKPFHTLAISVVHSLLAGALLSTFKGPRAPGHLTPLQSWLALLLLDVLLPLAVAWWHHSAAEQQQQGSPSTSSQSSTQAATDSPPGNASARQAQPQAPLPSAAREGLRHRAGRLAAEPASPAAPVMSSASARGAADGKATPQPISPGDSPQDPSIAMKQPVQSGPEGRSPAATGSHSMQPPSPASTTGQPAAPPTLQEGCPPAASAHQAGSSWHIPLGGSSVLQESNRPVTPVMDFEEAIAACARGAAARQASGLFPATALYHSQLHHRVVSIKAPLDAALEGQELMQLVLNQLKQEAPSQHMAPTPLQGSTPTTPSTTRPPAASTFQGPVTTSPTANLPGSSYLSPLMLHPVAMRGCLHLLLPMALSPPTGPSATAAAHSTPDAAVARLLHHLSTQHKAQHGASTGPDAMPTGQGSSDQPGRLSASPTGSSSSGGGGGGGGGKQCPSEGRCTQLCLQVDQSEPLLLTAHPDGSWTTQTNPGSASSSTSTSSNSPAQAHIADSATSYASAADCSSSGMGNSSNRSNNHCWLEPPCVALGGSSGSSRPTASVPSAPAAGDSSRPVVTIHGVPVAAGCLVRVLLVQGTSVVADQLLTAVLPTGEQAGAVQEGGQSRSVRLSLPESGLCAGPAMVCVLSPPSSLSAAATAPAGVSPAVAALLYPQQDSSSTRDQDKACSNTDRLKAARMWACLPLLLVDDAQAEQELTQLFTAMCGELQQQAAAMAADDRASVTPAQQEPFPQGLSSSKSKTSSSSSSSSAQQAYTQHWKALLWDWLYAVQGADASCAPGCIPQVAEQFRTSTKHPAAAAVGGLYERAAVCTMDDAPGSSSSSSSSSSSVAALASKHTITQHLLELLVGHELWAAVQQLQAAVVREAALAVAGNGQASPTAAAAGSDDYSAALALSPRVSSRHDSCESYSQYGTARTMQGYRPPLHCRDMLVPPRLSSREQQLQQQQQKYVHTLESPEHARTPLCQSQQQQEDGGESEQQEGCSPGGQGRQPAARRASASSAAVMSSGGLFDPHRRLSLDSLPLPYHPPALPSELYPPRWSVDLPPTAHTALHHQHHQQQQQVFFPPSALMAAGLHTTASPAMAAVGPLGPGHHSLLGQGMPMVASPLPPAAAAAAAAAAASGAAAAQAALLTHHLHPGSSFNSPASSLQSPAVRHPGPGSISRYPPHASPASLGASLAAHLHPQHSLGYSPSLGSSNSVATSVFVTADTPVRATGGYAGMPGPHGVQGRGSAGGPQPGGAAGGVDASVEGRHWAVFDTTGVEGFDQGLDTTAATNLATTTAGPRGVRSSAANSVTWLAIPTSHVSGGLPPSSMRTPRTSRHSGALHSSSTGKLRHSEQQHTVSSSLTPQPPRGHSLQHHTAASAEFLGHSSSSGTIPMHPHSSIRRQGPRTMLFTPAAGTSAFAAAAGYQQSGSAAAFSPEDASPPGPNSQSYMQQQVGSFNTPKRLGPARFTAASPHRALQATPSGNWPGHLINTLPTIGSEDSWDQNAEFQASPAPDTALTPPRAKLGAMQQQQQGAMSPVPLLPRLGELSTAAWDAALTPGPARSSAARAPLATPRSGLPPRQGAAAPTPRSAVHRSQQGSMTPAFYASRTGNLISGSVLGGAGGEGDTVSGALQLLGGGGSRLAHRSSAALSGFSSSSSDSPEGPYGRQHGGGFQGGYFTPVRPHKASSAAALLPASARPASRAAAWATPAVSGRNIPSGLSGAPFAAVGMSGSGLTAAALQQQQQQQHQVPDTPLLKAGRNIAGVLFSPAPPAPLSTQHAALMSTPSHIQSLLPPPGSASRLKAAAAAGHSSQMLPAGSSISSLLSPGDPQQQQQQQQSSAAAAMALLNLSLSPPAPSSQPPSTPPEPNTGTGTPGSVFSSESSNFSTQPYPLQLEPLSEYDPADMVTPCHTPRAGSPPSSPAAAAAAAASGVSVGLEMGCSRLSSPPPAPARPVPGVVLVPAVEAEDLYGSEEYLPEGYVPEWYGVPEGYGVPDEYCPEGYIPEALEKGEEVY